MLDEALLKLVIEKESKGPIKQSENFRIVPITDPVKLQTHLSYAAQMAEAIKRRGFEKRPVSTIQSASTQRLLDMSEEELKAYRNRPMPEKDQWKREDDAEKIFASHEGVKKDPDLISKEVGRRQQGYHQMGDAQSQGEGRVSLEKQEKAKEAWLTTIPAPYTSMEKHFIKEGHVINDPKPQKESLKDRFFKWTAKTFQGEQDHRFSWRDLQKDKK